MKTTPQALAINILSRAGRAFDEVAQCLAKGDQLGARNAIEYWQTVVCADDAEEIRKAGFSEENVLRSALLDLYKTTASLRFDPASSPDFRLASTNSSRSPSSTFWVSLRSMPVRRSLIRLWSST